MPPEAELRVAIRRLMAAANTAPAITVNVVRRDIEILLALVENARDAIAIVKAMRDAQTPLPTVHPRQK
jgi:hypothetical protein